MLKQLITDAVCLFKGYFILFDFGIQIECFSLSSDQLKEKVHIYTTSATATLISLRVRLSFSPIPCVIPFLSFLTYSSCLSLYIHFRDS